MLGLFNRPYNNEMEENTTINQKTGKRNDKETCIMEYFEDLKLKTKVNMPHYYGKYRNFKIWNENGDMRVYDGTYLLHHFTNPSTTFEDVCKWIVENDK